MKKWLIIIVGSLFFIALTIGVWEWIYLTVITTKEEVYILPQHFKGVVLIAYDQKDGSEDVIKDGRLIYKIPPNGILKLKRKSAATLSQSWYYFEDEQGKRTEFYYCFPPCDEMKDNPLKVFAFGASTGYSIGDENNYELHRTIFLVGAFKDADSLSKVYEKLNPIELLKNSK